MSVTVTRIAPVRRDELRLRILAFDDRLNPVEFQTAPGDSLDKDGRPIPALWGPVLAEIQREVERRFAREFWQYRADRFSEWMTNRYPDEAAFIGPHRPQAIELPTFARRNVCKHCGKSFAFVPRGRFPKWNAGPSVCSDACISANWLPKFDYRIAVRSEARREARADRTCEHCGESFTPQRGGAKGRFCSTKCRVASHRARGKDGPHGKPMERPAAPDA